MVGVECSYVVASEALDNEHHDILAVEGDGVPPGGVHRTIDTLQFVSPEVVRHHKDGLADGANQRERGVQHQGRIGRTLSILVGIGNGDGAHGRCEAPTHACHTQWCKQHQTQRGADDV